MRPVELARSPSQFDSTDVSAQGHFEGSEDTTDCSYFKEITWVDLTKHPPAISAYRVGLGVNVSSNLKVGESNTLRLQVVYGEGIENYMNDAPVDVGIKNNRRN